MKQQLDIQTREEIIQAKLIDKEPLTTMVTTLRRIEDLEEECFTLRALLFISVYSILMLIVLIRGMLLNELVEAVTFIAFATIPGYLGLKNIERGHKNKQSEHDVYRSQV